MSSINHLSEIDSLRSQVAELERTLAERDRSMQDLHEHRHLLRTIAEGTAVETGDEFFASLVTHLTSTLPVQYAAIGEVIGDQPKKIRTLAASTTGALIDNFEYDLAHTPCAVALSQTFTCFNRDVQATFPHFQRLTDLGAESYCAVPLWTKGRGVIGLLVVMDTKPLTNSDDLQSLLKVFAPRVTAELERRRAEQEYVQALTDVRNVMDTVPDILFTLDNQGRLVKWNRRLGDVTGYSPEELLHKPALAFVPPEEQTRTAAAIQRAFTEGYAELDGHLLTKEQRLIPYHWTGALLKNPHGEPIGITGVGQDVAEKKRAEEALQESEARYRILSEATFDGIGIHDQGILIEVNPGLEKMFGYGPGELIGKNILDMVADESREMVIAKMRMGASGPYESVGRRKDGSTFYGEVVVKYHRYHGREVRLVAGRDITKRKRAEEALARREQELRTVLDALPVGVWFTDARGKIMLSNPAARKIWTSVKQVSMSDTEMDAQWWERTDPLDEPNRWALTRALVKGESTSNEILEIECQDGSRKIVSNSAVPVHGAHGSLLGAILLNEDITMLRRTQEALKLTQFSVDRAVEGFFWVGPDARILHVNDAACRLLEYTREELTAMTVHDIDPNFPPEVWPAHWAELKEKGSLTFESRHWSRTGRVLDTEVTVNYLQYEGKEYNCAIMRDIGERKRTDAALRQSEERFRKLVEEAPLGMTVLDEQGRYVKVNRAFCNLVGYREDELLGQTYKLVTHPDDLSYNRSLTAKVICGEISGYRLEKRCIRKDGQAIWVTVNATSMALPKSTDHHLVAIIEDITERKRAEEALARSSERLELAAGAAQIGVWDWDISKNELVWDDRMFILYGVGKEDFGGAYDAWLAGVHPDDRARCDGAIQQALCKETPYNTEFRICRPNGTVRVIKADGQVIWDTDGTPLRMTGVNYDITERKRAEEELRESHSFLRQILDINPNFIFAKDRDGRFTLVNKTLADAYGATVDELIGKTDVDFNANRKEVAFFRQKDLEVMNTLQDIFIPEEVITDSMGIPHWVQTMKRPILDEQGRATMVLGTATDITSRKRLEETLRQRERDLQAAIQERERISQDLHDGILQSLFAVGLTLEVSKSLMSPQVRKKSGASLDQAIDQLNRVMQEIRNFIAGIGSDLLQGKDLPAALQHMLDSLRKHQAMCVRLKVEARAARALSAEQSLHLFLVIQEAVSNCIQHGHAQEARVSLKMLKQGVRLSVRDNGRGFDQETAKGTGHGLGNMAARAHKIGGRFTVVSKVNEGTRIVLDLPKGASDVLR
ncbi:MAG: PAS domain S-box protein [Nitrospiraceae bacterium]